MAKKSSTSRSQKIRDYLTEEPTATPNQIVEALAKKGIKISAGLASNVKYTSGPGARKKKKGPGRKKTARGGGRRGGPGRRAGTSLTLDNLLEAKKLVNDLGGIKEARKALDALEELT